MFIGRDYAARCKPAASGDDAHLGDAKTLAQTLDHRHEPHHVGRVSGEAPRIDQPRS
jgi:hypothetical protein